MALESNAGPAGILPHHLSELRASGLSDATIRKAGIRSEANYAALAAALGWRSLPKRMAPALLFPYTAADGSNGYTRAKFDHPRTVGGKLVKYESARRARWRCSCANAAM
ncbi:MAG: hypothetical protein K2Y37_13000 [Pirellulales bacterium]|nr:hypothetical protein [Pirellulales bacterium]